MVSSKVILSCFLYLAITALEVRPEAARRFNEEEVIYPVSFGTTRRYMRFRETPVYPPKLPNNRFDSPLVAPKHPYPSSDSLSVYSHPGSDSGLEYDDAQSLRNHSLKAAVKAKPRKRARDPNSSSKPKSEPKTPVARADEEENSFSSFRNFLSHYIPSPIRSLLQSEPREDVEGKKVRKGTRTGTHRFRPQGLRSASQNDDNIPKFNNIPTWHPSGQVDPGHGQPSSFSQIDSELSYESPSSFHPLQRDVSFSSPLSFHPAEREVSYTRSSVFPTTQREILYSSPYSYHPAEREVSYHRPSTFHPEEGLISYSSSHSFPPIEREISHSSLINFPTLQDEVSYSRPVPFSPANREISYSSPYSFPSIQREASYSGLQPYRPLREGITYSSYPSYPPARKEITYSSYPSYPPVPRGISYSSLKSYPSVQNEISHPTFLDPEFPLSFDHDIYSDIPQSYSKFFGTMHDHYPPSYTYSKPLSEGYTTLPKRPIYSPIMRSSRVQSDNSNQIDAHYEPMPKMYKSSTNKRETDILYRPYSLRFVTPPPVYGEERYVSLPLGVFTGHHMKSFGNSTPIVFPHSPHHPSSHLPLHSSQHVPTHPMSHHLPQTVSHSPTHPPPNPPPHPPPHSAIHSSPYPPTNSPSHNSPLQDRVTREDIGKPDHATPITFPGGSSDIIATDDGFNISAATGNGICDLKNGQTMYAGTCELLLSRSTCLENHWLVLLKNGIPACAYRRCPHAMIFYEGNCVDPGDESVCGVGQMLYVHLTGEAECDCDPKHVYDPSSGRCYGEHEQGFCREAYYIEFRDNKAACVTNPCHQEGFVMQDGRCYQKEYDGVCPSPQIMFQPENGTAECVEIATKSIFGVSIQTACPTGSKRSFLRTCRSVFRMPTQRTFPKQRGVCPSSFTGGSRNSCRQTVSLFG